MATVKKGTLTAAPDRWKHLRPFNKRKVAKAERRAAKAEILAVPVKARDDSPAG